MREKAIVGFNLISPTGKTPSSRIRGLLPLAKLQQQGMPVELYQQSHNQQYKLVIFQKRYSAKERENALELKRQGALIVLDMCDNVFFNPLNDPLYARKSDDLQKMVKIADIVTTSTSELAKYFDKETVVIRDCVEPLFQKERSTRRIEWKKYLSKSTSFHDLVWFGTAESECGHRLMLQLLRLENLFVALQRDFKLRLTVLSNKKYFYRRFVRKLPLPTRYCQWKNFEQACNLLRQHEICLLPISPDPFTKCKTHNRLTLALSLGLGVVADRIPDYEQFAPYCFLDHWEEGLKKYLSNPTLRKQHVQQGCKYINDHFMVEHTARDWQIFLHRMLPNDIASPPNV